MENKQALKLTHIELEYHNLRLLVEYEVYGKYHNDYIQYSQLIPFLENSGIELKSEGTNVNLTELDNDDVLRIPRYELEKYVTNYLWYNLKIDILIENRDLKERLEKANEVIQIISDILRIRK